MNLKKVAVQKSGADVQPMCAGRPAMAPPRESPTKAHQQLCEQRRLERGHDRREAARRLLLLPRDAADAEGAKERLVARPVAE